MKKLLVTILFSVFSIIAFSQQTIWFETTQAHIGTKAQNETEYKWSPATYPKIKIAVETSRIIVYAEHTYIINIEGMFYESTYSTTFYGKDDEGVRCHVELGYSNEANQSYFIVKYSDIAFFYYAVPK